MITSTSHIGAIKSDNTEADNRHLFERYLLIFKEQTLPLKMDRKAVFDMMNHSDSLSVIGDSLKIFVPEELIKNHPDSKFRSLYVLPKYDNVVLVLIFQEYISKYDQRVFRNYLVSHDKNGEIIDYQELAGVIIDAREAFFVISSKYKIERKSYQCKLNMDKENSKFSRLVETTQNFELNSDGTIEEINSFKQEGYFKGDWSGYKFIKPINN